MLCRLVVASVDCLGNVTATVLAGNSGQGVLDTCGQCNFDAGPEWVGSKQEFEDDSRLEFGAEL